MLEAYSKPCQISKMMRHIENPGPHSLFRHFQTYSGTSSNIQSCSCIFRDTVNRGDFVSWGTLTTLRIFFILFNRTIHKDFVKTYNFAKFNLGISKGNPIQK